MAGYHPGPVAPSIADGAPLRHKGYIFEFEVVEANLRSLLPPPVDVEPDGGQDDDDDEEDGDDDGGRGRSSGRRNSPDLVLAIPAAVVGLAAARRVVQTDAAVLALADQRQGLGLLGG